jgi:hypothetical protein
MAATVHESAHLGRPVGLTAGDVPIADLTNDSLIIRLHFSVNHLSRWLTPIHDWDRMGRVIFRGQPSIEQLVVRMRQEERRIFPMIHLIATQNNPDLDRLPAQEITPEQAAIDSRRSVLSAMAEYRRLRQSTCSVLRSLTDTGWLRVGTSRATHDWQIRTLGEHLVAHDEQVLTDIDVALDRYGLREGIAAHGKAHLYELLKIVPVSRRNNR